MEEALAWVAKVAAAVALGVPLVLYLLQDGPYLPVSWLLKHPFDSLALAPRIDAPLLCIIAARDEIIPRVHSEKLFQAWRGPKRRLVLEGATHNATDDAPAFWSEIGRFLTAP